MKYVTPSAEIFQMTHQDVFTFSFFDEGDAGKDVLSFNDLVKREA